MNDQSFTLKPFHQTNPPPYLNITGNIARRSNIIAIGYTLFGSLSELVIPASASMSARKNALWEDTCFEFFISIKNSDRYWEFNLSPSGDWNVYRFKNYRQEMQEELAYTSLPFSVQSQTDALQLALELNLDTIVPAEETLNIDISTVIKQIDGKMT